MRSKISKNCKLNSFRARNPLSIKVRKVNIPRKTHKKDVPIILTDVAYEDSYQGDFESRRAIIYTMSFTTKFFLYGPVTSSKVIKTVQVDQYANLPDVTPTREQRYTVTPKPVTADADDDFGFNETTSFFEDAKIYDPVSGTDKRK